jgi:hypothetical protein
MATKNERRREERMAVQLELREHVAGRVHPALVTAMSSDGVTLTSAEGLPDYEQVALELRLPGAGEVIWTAAEPLWTSTQDGTRSAGLRFVDMEPGHRQLVRDYLIDRALRALEPRPPRRWLKRLGGRLAALVRSCQPSSPQRDLRA